MVNSINIPIVAKNLVTNPLCHQTYWCYNLAVILKGKTAIVTGASDGIGKQVTLKLANAGVSLALIARNKVNLEKTRNEILTNHPQIKVNIYPCDLTKTANLKTVINQIISDFKDVQILLNVAGIWQKVMPLDQIEEKVVDSVIAVNLTALIHCTRLVLPVLRRQTEAAIINISSRSGWRVKEGQSVYSASKWGVRGFTQVLAEDLKNTPIHVGAIYQAGVNTQMFAKTGDDFSLDKYTNPTDLADVIVFMLSRPEKLWMHEVRVEY